MKPVLKWTILLAAGAAGVVIWAYRSRRHGLGEFIPGGRAAGRRARDFDPAQLAMGIRIELEHTPDPRIAKEIAMDHLVEDPRYYTKLKRAGL